MIGVLLDASIMRHLACANSAEGMDAAWVGMIELGSWIEISAKSSHRRPHLLNVLLDQLM